MQRKQFYTIVGIFVLAIGLYFLLPLIPLSEPPVDLTASRPRPSPRAAGATKAYPAVKDQLAFMNAETLAQFVRATDAVKNNATIRTEPVAEDVRIVSRGTFAPRAHSVQGNALVLEARGTRLLRLENFETRNGPELHVYLSPELGLTGALDLGVLRATKGNVNYPLPPGADLSKYRFVLIWSVPYRVLFGYAELE